MVAPFPVTSNLCSSNDTRGAALDGGAGALGLGWRKIDGGATAATPACQVSWGVGDGGGAWLGGVAALAANISAAAALQVASGGGDEVEPTPG